MRAIGRVVGTILFWLGYISCFVMVWVQVIHWWGWNAIWAFFLSPILAFLIPFIAWFIEGTFPVLLFAGWGSIVLGAVLNYISREE